jgi:hypothetical protein
MKGRTARGTKTFNLPTTAYPAMAMFPAASQVKAPSGIKPTNPAKLSPPGGMIVEIFAVPATW